ncbi:hypothetical protein [Dokdonella sp.]|uniref:hypothetical protein n=1 Tax=Dokdonella sp. TaxID=2291710 RepID=UPI0031C4ED74|nr:hypothetical protein [Dokdonella sp.]
MGLDFLHYGVLGALEAAGLAALAGCVLYALARLLRRPLGWREGTEFGVAFALAVVVGAGVDAWDLFTLGIVRPESPFAIQQRLASIHDPDALGMRVVLEFLGAAAGVTLGWLLLARGKR